MYLQRKTIGEILRDEIKIEGICLGMNDEEIKNIYPVSMMTTNYVLSQFFTPKWAGRKLKYNRRDLMKMQDLYKEFLKDMGKQAAIFSECNIEDPKAMEKVTQQELFRKAEACSFNVHANAKGMFTFFHIQH